MTVRPEEELERALSTLRHHRKVMVDYADVKIAVDDRHGVQDAMSDLRELDAGIRALEFALGRRLTVW